jgi:long-subunit fatty acid transport protein
LASAGTSYRFDHARVSIEGAWYDWSAFDELHLRLSDGDNAEFDALAGTTPVEVFPLDWRDTFAIRVGYEHFFESSVLRLGYIYNLNPIPSHTLTPLLPGTLEHSIAIGFGHDFGAWDLDLAYQYAWADAQKVGTSGLAGDDLDSSELRAQAHWFFVSLAAKF